MLITTTTTILAQTPGLSAATLFYLTLVLIFLGAIITTVLTKWTRDKCLKFFDHYHVTMERSRGQTVFGTAKIFSSGIEIVFDHPFVDPRGRKKTSYMLYGPEMDGQLLCLLRYHQELDEPQQKLRLKQVHATFNPGFLRRLWRSFRNFINTLRDAFNAAIGAVVTQYQRVNPAAGSILASQGAQVTQIGQTLLGRFANSYEPLLEQYIGQPVIMDVADPLNPNNATVEYTGYLADYTQNFIALFNVEHKCSETVELAMPEQDRGETLPPLPPAPPPGAPPIALPEPLKVEHDLAVRLDGLRFKVMNVCKDPVVIRHLEREGFEPVEFGMVLPPSATLDLPARDAKGGKLVVDVVRTVDIVASRKFATIRHAGELVDRPTLFNEFSIQQLPLVPKLMKAVGRNGRRSEQ
jgi:hypothetical protein